MSDDRQPRATWAPLWITPRDLVRLARQIRELAERARRRTGPTQRSE